MTFVSILYGKFFIISIYLFHFSEHLTLNELKKSNALKLPLHKQIFAAKIFTSL